MRWGVQGGVDVGDVDSKATRSLFAIDEDVTGPAVVSSLLGAVPAARRDALGAFVAALLAVYRKLHFCYMEINPLVMTGDSVESITPLDLAAKIDEAADFLCHSLWGGIDFPPPWGAKETPEEAYIRSLDAKTGASLKLTLLNPRGRVWTLVAGGGASVVYADTIADLGYGHELANYGEYSGAPTEDLTFEYARTILSLMTKHPREDGLPKILIIGGGIANFTDVAKTFKGIMLALTEAAPKLREQKVSVWVRRGGPNYEEGLKIMRDLGLKIGVPIHVYGPRTHITAIVPLALGLTTDLPVVEHSDGEPSSLASMMSASASGGMPAQSPTAAAAEAAFASASKAKDRPPKSPADIFAISAERGSDEAEVVRTTHGRVASAQGAIDAVAPAGATTPGTASRPAWELFDSSTRCVVFGMQTLAVQSMLDFDFMCRRDTPSVAAIVFPFASGHQQQFYWGPSEILVPVYQSVTAAFAKHPEADVLINFASYRSAYDVSMEAIRPDPPLVRSVAVIAEGIPERLTRMLIHEAGNKGVTVIGPATVGGIKPGSFRIGNTAGMIDNVVAAKLYRPGCVGYVSKSGGMSNELNNIMAEYADGVAEGVAIGGDRYPGSRFIDHLMRYEQNPDVKMLVMLGEVGGTDEYVVAEAIREGRITKPLVAWCIGTCAKVFPYEVQFGHAGALANSAAQTADAKNAALKDAGAIVPDNFNDFVSKIRDTYLDLIASGAHRPLREVPPRRIPMDFQWAKQLGIIRKPANFISTISDDRGEELSYAGMPIGDIVESGIGVGGVVSLLWFRRKLPEYAARFIDIVLVVTADHGPAVAGAHNTIVASRAGKDLVSSLASGLLTIGPRFGGALDGAAEMFTRAVDAGTSPKEFVEEMRKQNKLIMGIGHKVKSIHNPDKRVTLIKDFAKKHFEATPTLDFALGVEEITVKKKPNLILNVDGCIAACFVDLLRTCGAFTRQEADDAISQGCLNGLFVLGRSVGLIGHFLDQKRLKQGLYRHPTDDISYLMPDVDV
jgi:ATP citrate (pro-S)-lyase